ncbi:T9SS type A sorting domain-containing protein [Tenacibaculum maritimum]|uniref:T9SS type A sorting domain-containing protein n=1 Tax=Tenacibaculum maritimum TaxID=107401 RepID=UPI0012E690CC|nr:T9SS type A sorting domain-containing protein [Tenacibaculum maritimum]CAA0195851.1 Protein of unknown function precursor containing a C-terminal secretion signal [Tenacibaculum maritimum]CAA0197594.1 Protein of unknown function precursor containing a C-terminal secretion signal [Tenacibaculum maritimum]
MKKVFFLFFAFASAISNAQNVIIPDANFKTALVGNPAINTNNDSEIQLTEASSYTEGIDISNKNIADLTGIEAFTKLKSLSCYGNQLRSLDLSKNVNLEYLYCYSNSLESIDVSSSARLNTFYCQGNKLESLNITANKELVYFDCSTNELTSLDVSQNTRLSKLYCHTNKLAVIDVKANEFLSLFYCYNNNGIANLDVTNNLYLTKLGCGGNRLTSLDLSNNSRLTKLYCALNDLTVLNLANGNGVNFREIEANGNNNLSCVQVDDAQYSNENWVGTKFRFDAMASFSTNCVASVEEEESELIGIYPVPVKNRLNLRVKNQKVKNILIVDISGKIIKESIPINNTIDVKDLAKGGYFLRVKTDKGMLHKQFLKE